MCVRGECVHWQAYVSALDDIRLSRRLHTGMHPGPGIMVVYPYDNTEYEPVKLGASILEQSNKNMWCVMEEFGLERIDC